MSTTRPLMKVAMSMRRDEKCRHDQQIRRCDINRIIGKTCSYEGIYWHHLIMLGHGLHLT